MKKLILLVCMVVGVSSFGAEFLGWNCTDVEAMQTSMQTEKNLSWKNFYEVKIAYLANPENFDTWEKFLSQTEPITKKNFKDETSQKAYIAQLIYCNATNQRDKYFVEAYNYCASTTYQVHFVKGDHKNLLNLSNEEKFDKVSAFLIENDTHLSNVVSMIDYLTKIDLRINKDKKIETYLLLHEKYYTNLSQEEWYAVLTKLGLKLKSLGIEVK